MSDREVNLTLGISTGIAIGSITGAALAAFALVSIMIVDRDSPSPRPHHAIHEAMR